MKKWIFLTVIIIIASVLRLYDLGHIPISLNSDETLLGYNAYSISKIGHDEYRTFSPVSLRSLGNDKPILYSYLDAPFVAAFGLTPFAVRLPSALAGIFAVIFLNLLLLELFEEKKLSFTIRKFCIGIPEVGALILAVSPLHIQFSRIAFEGNIAVTLNILAVWLFLKGLKRPWLLSFSLVSFFLGLYTYQGENEFVLLLVLALVIIYRGQLFSLTKKTLVIPLITGIIISLPFLFVIISNPISLSHAWEESVIGHPYQSIQQAAVYMQVDRQNHDILGVLMDNSKVEYAKIILSNYLAYFNPNWLFVTGDSTLQNQATGMGHLYLWELLTILVGMLTLWTDHLRKETKQLLFIWLLIVPISVAFLWDVPNITRVLNFIPVLQIFSALGLIVVINFLTRKQPLFTQRITSYVLLVVFLSFIFFNFLYYIDQYFVQYNYFSAASWQYGYQDAVQYIQQHHNKYTKIIVSDQPPLSQSYIFFLFGMRYSPKKYQQEIQSFVQGKSSHHAFGRFEFGPVRSFTNLRGNVLYIGSTQDFSSGQKPIYEVKNPDGTIALELVESNY